MHFFASDDDDAYHDVSGAEYGDRRAVVHVAPLEVVILARGSDGELHSLSWSFKVL